MVFLFQPLPACGCPSRNCGQQNYPYAISGGQTPEEDPTTYDVKAPSYVTYSYEESSYEYGTSSEDEDGSDDYTSGSNQNVALLRPHSESQQTPQRSISLTWNFQGANDRQLGNQRPSIQPIHPQGQDQRSWNHPNNPPPFYGYDDGYPGQTSQPRPGIQPIGPQRPYSGRMGASMHDSQPHPSVQPLGPQRPSFQGYDGDPQVSRPTPKPRHHTLEQPWHQGGNVKGEVPRYPCPYSSCQSLNK